MRVVLAYGVPFIRRVFRCFYIFTVTELLAFFVAACVFARYEPETWFLAQIIGAWTIGLLLLQRYVDDLLRRLAPESGRLST